MHSIPAAFAWETFARGRWFLVAGFLGGAFVGLLVLGALARRGGLPPEEPALIVLHITLSQLTLIGLGISTLAMQGKPSRLFTFPISTSELVAYQLGFPLVLTVAGSLLYGVLLNTV